MSFEIHKPIFVVGTGRSGSTVFFDIFTKHPRVAWLSSLADRYPDRVWLHSLLDAGTQIRIDGRNSRQAFWSLGSVSILGPRVPRILEPVSRSPCGRRHADIRQQGPRCSRSHSHGIPKSLSREDHRLASRAASPRDFPTGIVHRSFTRSLRYRKLIAGSAILGRLARSAKLATRAIAGRPGCDLAAGRRIVCCARCNRVCDRAASHGAMPGNACVLSNSTGSCIQNFAPILLACSRKWPNSVTSNGPSGLNDRFVAFGSSIATTSGARRLTGAQQAVLERTLELARAKSGPQVHDE